MCTGGRACWIIPRQAQDEGGASRTAICSGVLSLTLPAPPSRDSNCSRDQRGPEPSVPQRASNLRDPSGKGLTAAIARGPRRRYPLALHPRSTPRRSRERPVRRKAFMTDATIPRAGLFRSAWASPNLLLVVTMLIWAGHSVVARLSAGEIGPMTLTCMRWALALVPILAAARPFAASRLAGVARQLALSRRHGRTRLHRLQCALLSRPRTARARSTCPLSRGRSRRSFSSASAHSWAFASPPPGARRRRHDGRRRRDRRPGRFRPAHCARVQRRRRHDRGRSCVSLRRLHGQLRQRPRVSGLSLLAGMAAATSSPPCP